MPFIRIDEIDKELVTPAHSTGFGELVTGESIEVGRLFYKATEGATEHAHPQEQIMVVIEGRLRAVLDGEVAEVGPGEGYLAPSGVAHEITALEDTLVLSCKNVIGGAGHRI